MRTPPKFVVLGLLILGSLLTGCGGGSSSSAEVEGLATANSLTAVSPTD